ncbi:unnamed protein product [Chrysodeixis includens]|uniref:Lipase domain-containing protein n=1 Tax=Chrysodeixis includens TaxID=689277 RepID=A0A9P0BQ46_CHRIL|nr:unnamed protein product [Chrysodeixis includens]
MNKALLGFLIATVCAVTAVPLNSVNSEGLVPQGFEDVNGIANLEGELDEEVIEDAAASNVYLLYTRRNPTDAEILEIDDKDSIRKSNFKSSKKTIVIAHSWLGDENNDMNAVIRDAFLAQEDGNVIVLDWRKQAVSNYVTAARAAPEVGRGLGKFITFLTKVTKQSLKKIHLVGFGLGAHLVGNAGRELNGKVARITGLDPSGPLFNFNSNRISPDDAIYVEAIHTDGDTIEGLGIGSDVGNANFYVNGGNSQPGCLTQICNHNRAWRIFASTITYNHLSGNECANSLQVTLNRCRGDELAMGNIDLTKSVEGVKKFRANTRILYPY